MSMVEQLAHTANNILIKPRRLPRPWTPSLEERVAGRTALITGASSGIGRALAERLAAAGATTLLVARRGDELEQVVAAIRADGGSAHAIVGDLSTAEGVDAVADRVLGEFGPPDVLVNNAGRSIRRSIANSEHRLHDYERTIRVNYLGAVGLTLRLLPGMRERGSGYVLASSSIGVQADLPRFSAYVASKSALDAFQRVAAVECLADGVRFGTVHLPLVDTEMIGPTKWDGFRPLSVEEAVELLVDAVRRQADHVDVPLGAMAATGTRFMPRTSRTLLHYFHRMMRETDPAEARRAAAGAVSEKVNGVAGKGGGTGHAKVAGGAPKPDDAPATTGTASGEPDDASGELDDASAQAHGASAKIGAVSTKADDSAAKAGGTSAQTGNASAKDGVAPTKAVRASAKSGNGASVKANNASAKTGGASAKAGGASSTTAKTGNASAKTSSTSAKAKSPSEKIGDGPAKAGGASDEPGNTPAPAEDGMPALTKAETEQRG